MKKFTDKRILLPVALTAGLLTAVIWGLSVGGPLPGNGITADGVVISEVCAKNEGVIADNDGRCRAYIELYNGGEDTNLQGFCLTDGKTRSEPFGDMPFPADSYQVVFLDKALTGFSLKATGGETVTLVDSRNCTPLAQAFSA